MYFRTLLWAGLLTVSHHLLVAHVPNVHYMRHIIYSVYIPTVAFVCLYKNTCTHVE